MLPNGLQQTLSPGHPLTLGYETREQCKMISNSNRFSFLLDDHIGSPNFVDLGIYTNFEHVVKSIFNTCLLGVRSYTPTEYGVQSRHVTKLG